MNNNQVIPYMFFKFGTKENITSLQSGHLYMKNLQYYVNCEKETNNDTSGDMYEGHIMQKDVLVVLSNPDTKAHIATIKADISALNIGYLKNPVFCLFTLYLQSNKKDILKENILQYKYLFSDEQKQKMKKFGEYALMIHNLPEFYNRLRNALFAKNIEFAHGLVKYYDNFNDYNYQKDVSQYNYNVAFWKRAKYSYQQEYRFLLNTQVDDHIIINLNDLKDISMMLKTTDLLNSQIDICLYNHYNS